MSLGSFDRRLAAADSPDGPVRALRGLDLVCKGFAYQ